MGTSSRESFARDDVVFAGAPEVADALAALILEQQGATQESLSAEIAEIRAKLRRLADRLPAA